MIAFCIIVGDTIPHVMIGFFPSLQDMHFLWLLTDRRGAIVIFILLASSVHVGLGRLCRLELRDCAQAMLIN